MEIAIPPLHSSNFPSCTEKALYWWVLRGFWGTNKCFKICCFGPVLALLTHSMHFLRSCRNSSVQRRSKKSRKIVPTMRPFAWGGGVETLFGGFPFEQHFSYIGASLTVLTVLTILKILTIPMIIVIIHGIAVGVVGAGRCGEPGRQLEEKDNDATGIRNPHIDCDEIGDGEDGNIRWWKW